MTIAVTGATGHLGTLIIHDLLDTVPAAEIVAIARSAEKAAPLAELGVDVRLADYSDQAALEAALAGVDKLVLVSGNAFGLRAAQHRNVIEAARAAGVGFIAYTSLLHAPTSPLGLAAEHVETEAILEASGIRHTLLRNGWYHENFGGAIDTARATGSLVTNAGGGLVSSAARADYAAAAAKVVTAENPDRIYELAGDIAWTQPELAATVAQIIGSEVSLSQVDADTHARILTDAGLDEGTSAFLVDVDSGIAVGALEDTSGALSKLIGRPTTSLADSLRALA